MQIILSLLSSMPYFEWPYTVLGWAVWLLLFLITGFLIWQWRGLQQVKHSWVWALLPILIILTPVTTLFFGFRFPQENAMPIPGMPVESSAPVIMFFAALPWVLAAGIFGPLIAVSLAIFGGIFLAFWETHNSFTPLELGALALAFTLMVRQNYRTPVFRLWRHPLGAALSLAVAFAPLYILTAFFSTRGSLAVRIDYALTQTWPIMIGRGVELIVAGLFAEIIFQLGADFWFRPASLVPSPSERNLQLRFFYTTAPFVFLLFLTLTVSDWVMAGNAARNMIEVQLSGATNVAAQSLPYFLETGQNLIKMMAQENLITLPREELPVELEKHLRSVPFFRALVVFDMDGPVTGYPQTFLEKVELSEQELAGIELARKGVLIQTYTVKTLPDENSTQVSFLASIRNGQGQVIGVLLGRTDFNSNPFTQPAIDALKAVVQAHPGATGTILSEDGLVLYDTLSSQVMTTYVGLLPAEDMFFDELSPQGTRQLNYAKTMIGRPWRIILSVPAEVAQQLALDIAVPLLIVLCLLSLVAFVSLRLGLRSIVRSLQNLARETTLIAQGRFDHPLPVQGVDEVGRFGRAFEQMRLSLKARLEELNRLLMVSQGVAATLEAGEAVMPVLQAALGQDASVARVVLVREVTLDLQAEQPVAFGVGPAASRYANLDEHIFEMMRQQDLLTIPNTSRIKWISFTDEIEQPGALLAISLHHESFYYGALWVGYDQPHNFSEEEIRFLSTLAGQAALAAANARLYATAEIGRQRLEAVLSSTPEPVLVIDGQMRLLLLNPAALQVPGLVLSSTSHEPINQILGNMELLELIQSAPPDRMITKEIKMANERVYFASVSPVNAQGRSVGKICILRDITHYKELDTLKSDFVSTVSHDLRSPLTLMRGYATMLQMVGELNEQQRGYVNKIIAGVEGMARLVGNLLDLGRIEAGIGLKIEKVSAVDILEQVISSLQPQAAQKHIELGQEKSVSRTVQRAIMLYADPALLGQALYNLVENAIKYTPVGGKVKVDLRVRSTSVVFEVKDNGIGIAPLDLPHMFEKFYRSGRREAYQQRGTGLGLAIVKSIAELHNGRVWVESQLGKGSTFFIEIPFEQTDKVASKTV